MSIEHDKLLAFENAILEETNREVEAMEADLQKYKEEELQKAKDEEYNRFFVYMQEQVHALKARYKKNMTKAELAGKQDLLRFRNRLTDAVFATAEARILEFSASERYPDFLIGEITAALAQFPCDAAAVSLRAEDLKLESAIRAACPTVSAVSVDKKNRLGGFCLINQEKGLLADHTFGSKLQDKRPAFYASCGLSVQF